jgi:hypothetical protein
LAKPLGIKSQLLVSNYRGFKCLVIDPLATWRLIYLFGWQEKLHIGSNNLVEFNTSNYSIGSLIAVVDYEEAFLERRKKLEHIKKQISEWYVDQHIESYYHLNNQGKLQNKLMSFLIFLCNRYKLKKEG